MKLEIKIPDIAENVETGIVARVMVSKGDQVEKDQSLIEVETDKATTEIPSSHRGNVDEIKIKEGEEVKVGQVIMILEGEEGGEEEDMEQPEEKKKEEEERKEEERKEEDTTGDDDREEAEKREKPEPGDIPASPSVRRLAREYGVDLREVKGTGPGERITAEDVKSYSEEEKREKTKTSPEVSEGLPDFSDLGPISREPLERIRKLTAQRMQESWQEIPHVTQFDEADITELEKFRQKNRERFERSGGKLTVTSILLKISAFALQRFPRFNTSLDAERDELIYKHYYNIGIAVDTDRGLLVPVIRDVDRKSLEELTLELKEQSGKARNKKISPDDLQGGNFTISNLGGIGGTAFTPIVYSPQVAILGISRSGYRQVYVDGEFDGRLILPLSLSYDHRVIDGAEGARFLRWVCDVLEDPYMLLQ